MKKQKRKKTDQISKIFDIDQNFQLQLKYFYQLKQPILLNQINNKQITTKTLFLINIQYILRNGTNKFQLNNRQTNYQLIRKQINQQKKRYESFLHNIFWDKQKYHQKNKNKQ
ncbi:hypothetical protein ABPG72_021935 [Tetrahymena utriculariae]